MKVLIVEDSLGLVVVYQNIIENIIHKKLHNENLEFVSIVNYNEYSYFKDNLYDLAIIDWNIIGGTSKRIIEEGFSKIKFCVFITGYANNRQLQALAKKYSIPIISKPTTEIEISNVLEKKVMNFKKENI